MSPKARVQSLDWVKVAQILIFAKQVHALAVRVPASTIPSGRVTPQREPSTTVSDSKSPILGECDNAMLGIGAYSESGLRREVSRFRAPLSRPTPPSKRVESIVASREL
jgi:hypothetical protein